MNELEKEEEFKKRINEAINKRDFVLDGDGIMSLSVSVQQEEQWRQEGTLLKNVIKIFDEVYKGDESNEN